RRSCRDSRQHCLGFRQRMRRVRPGIFSVTTDLLRHRVLPEPLSVCVDHPRLTLSALLAPYKVQFLRDQRFLSQARTVQGPRMTQVLDWHKAGDVSSVIQSAVQALSEGKLVAFPTETVYGLAVRGLIPDAVKRLRQGRGRPADKPLALAIRGAWEVLDWVPDLSPLGRRLARRCWPGPVTLVFPVNLKKSRAGWLPEFVQQQVCPAGAIGFRVPNHDAIQMTLGRIQSPLVLSSANRSGEPPATRAEEVVEAVGEEVALVIDDGPSCLGLPSTVVQVNDNSWQVLREGAVSSADIGKQAARVILFVCTGNTCRSPMAEGLCKKL